MKSKDTNGQPAKLIFQKHLTDAFKQRAGDDKKHTDLRLAHQTSRSWDLCDVFRLTDEPNAKKHQDDACCPKWIGRFF